MKQFALFFYLDISSENQPDEATLASYMSDWNAWTAELSASGKLQGGNHFGPQAATIQSDGSISYKPVSNLNLSIAGYLVIGAADLTEAMQAAQKCPILKGEGNWVEVREIA